MPNTIGLLGKKIGMTRLYDDDGRATPVTALEMPPCVVVQKKTVATDGYNAIQLGFGSKKESKMTKAEIGHVKLAGKGGFSDLKEFRVSDPDQYEVGQNLGMADIFQIGQLIDVSGVSKGRGFQGVMKRHGFRGGSGTHGCGWRRKPGSIGCSAWPSRVVKGKKMPGRMGGNLVTKKNVIVIDMRPEDNIMLVKGSVPGAKQSLLQVFYK
jgi:large subunit ribosomal protein L3